MTEDMNGVIRTAMLVPALGLPPLGLAILTSVRRLVPAAALAHPGRPTGTGRQPTFLA
jgi:hypothetical protein